MIHIEIIISHGHSSVADVVIRREPWHRKVNAVIHSQEKLAEGIYSMWLDAPEMAEVAVPDSLSLFTKMTRQNFFRVRSVSVRRTRRMEDFGSFTASREPAQRSFPNARQAIPWILWGRWEMDSL